MLKSHWVLGVVVPCIVGFGPGEPGPPTEPSPQVKVRLVPPTETLQEMHDLRASLTRLALKQRCYKAMMKREPENRAGYEVKAGRVCKQVARVHARIKQILGSEMGAFVRASADASLDCSEEHYSEVILYATASKPIAKGELLLFHAGDIYRTRAKFEPLRTTGQGFFFRPDRDIPAGARFTATCIQDAPEEIANVKKGYMPHSDRARDPARAYDTRVKIDARK